MDAYCTSEGPVKLIEEFFFITAVIAAKCFTLAAMEKVWAWNVFLVKASNEKVFCI